MSDESVHIERLKDIRQMMERSSRFISLSGLSGVAAGICAIAASVIAYFMIDHYKAENGLKSSYGNEYIFHDGYQHLEWKLAILAAITLAVSVGLAFLFTWLRSKKTGMPIWGPVARRVMLSVLIPMAIGGVFLVRLATLQVYGLMAPACLIFYGLGLISASRYTFSEIRYLGYAQLVLGAICLWLPGSGLLFWAIGFGLLHVIYGAAMWLKYEKNGERS